MLSRLAQAIIMATEAHDGQVDKGGKPYILHPLRVMLHMDTEDEMITAVLHDTVEDTNLSRLTILQTFGPVVLEAVDSVTRIVAPVKELHSDLIRRSKLNLIGKKVKYWDVKDNMSPERVAQLPEEEKGIVKRYEKALKILEEGGN
jgi:GTP diphosphokinase / guanosine-3',5'-bis(diphosphate) 3'-diphosphatase